MNEKTEAYKEQWWEEWGKKRFHLGYMDSSYLPVGLLSSSTID